MTREQSEYDFEFESLDKSFFELSATIKSGKGLFEFYIWIFVLLAVPWISWVFSLNYWYQYVYNSTSDTFYYSKRAGNIFIVPMVIATVLTLLYFYDERRFNIHKQTGSTSIFRPYVWKISQFQRYMKCIIPIALVTTMYCTIWSLITIGSLYSTNVPPPFKKDGVDYSCWSSLWKNYLPISAIINPPHELMSTLFAETPNCDLANVSPNYPLNLYLDDIIFAGTKNYAAVNMVGTLLAHVGLLSLATVLLTIRQPRDEFVHEELKKRIKSSLSLLCPEEQAALSELFKWIEDSVYYYAVQDIRQFEEASKEKKFPSKKTEFYSPFAKRYPFILGFFISIAVSVLIELMGLRPGTRAVQFMVDYQEPLYGGPFWSNCLRFGFGYSFLAIVGFIVMPGLEWSFLIAIVYEYPKRMQEANALRMKLLQVVIDPSLDLNLNCGLPVGLLRHWILTSNLHGWYCIREFIKTTAMKRDHLLSELGVVALLFIALFLSTVTAFTYVTTGFLGQGILGPWSIVACPFLITLVTSLLTHALQVHYSQLKQKEVLRLLAKQKALAENDFIHQKAYNGVPITKSIVERLGPLECSEHYDKKVLDELKKKNIFFQYEQKRGEKAKHDEQREWTDYIASIESLQKVAEVLEEFDTSVRMLGVPVTPASFSVVVGYFCSVSGAVVVNYFVS